MGAGAVLSVVVGNLLSSFVLIPLTLTLLEAGSAGQTDRKASVVVWESVLSAVKKPLVWAPLLGVLMALLHIPLPGVAQKFFTLIGQATSGVALFAMGLLLAGQTFHVSVPSLANVTFKNLLQPAVMWGFALLLGVAGFSRREMILPGALPTASMTAMFAVQYKVYTNDSNATIVVSTVFSIVTLGAIIALTS
jgi:predicted permease